MLLHITHLGGSVVFPCQVTTTVAVIQKDVAGFHFPVTILVAPLCLVEERWWGFFFLLQKLLEDVGRRATHPTDVRLENLDRRIRGQSASEGWAKYIICTGTCSLLLPHSVSFLSSGGCSSAFLKQNSCSICGIISKEMVCSYFFRGPKKPEVWIICKTYLEISTGKLELVGWE